MSNARNLANLLGTGTTIPDAKIAGLTASKLTGTIADARFPATLPAISGANLTNISSGKTLGITKFENNTRTTTPAQDTYDFFTGNVTQVKANSKFMVHVQLHGWQDYSGAINLDLIYDGVTHSGYAGFTYNAQDYWQQLMGQYYISGSSTTGSKAFIFRQNCNASTASKPFIRWNPNASDDSRLKQTVSSIIFIEYDF